MVDKSLANAANSQLFSLGQDGIAGKPWTAGGRTGLGKFLVFRLLMDKAEAKALIQKVPDVDAMRPEQWSETLEWLMEELQPGVQPWADAVRRDPLLLAAGVDTLREALWWLEEFLWNREWAVGFGRQALSDAIQHRPHLLYQGADALEATALWLQRHGVDDDVTMRCVAGPTAVPFPLEHYPWIELFQVGANGLEDAARWAEEELGKSRDEVSAALRGDPNFILAAATAADAAPRQPRAATRLNEALEAVA